MEAPLLGEAGWTKGPGLVQRTGLKLGSCLERGLRSGLRIVLGDMNRKDREQHGGAPKRSLSGAQVELTAGHRGPLPRAC